MLETNKIYNMDCLDGIKQLDDNSIDLILTDLPYGVTQNKQDIPLPLDKLWNQYKRIMKERTAVIFTSQFPYTIDLINSNRKWFRYDLIWDKQLVSGFLNANRMPLRVHEHILIFYNRIGTYNPQFTEGKPQHATGKNCLNKKKKHRNYGDATYLKDERVGSTKKYPTSIISIKKLHSSIAIHPTQKPVPLFEYLIKTYSNEGDLVLDNCMGSGTTAVACKQLHRNFIGFETSEEYCSIAQKRLEKVVLSKRLGEI